MSDIAARRRELETKAQTVAFGIVSRFQIENNYGCLRGGAELIEKIAAALLAFGAAERRTERDELRAAMIERQNQAKIDFHSVSDGMIQSFEAIRISELMRWLGWLDKRDEKGTTK